MVSSHDELVLHDVEIKQISKSGTNPMAYIDPSVDYDACVESLKALFDDVRLRFQNENKISENFVPLFGGDGKPLDLFSIFWAVWNRGGCDFVSENKLWGSVAEECKLDCNVAEDYLKTVYMKYISELDRSFRATINTKWVENGNSKDEKIGLLMSDLQEEFSCFLQCAKKTNGEIVEFEPESGVTYHDVDILEINEVSDIVEHSQRTTNDYKKRKRNSNSLSSMVDWVVQVAKRPDDMVIRQRVELRAQALLAREALRRVSCLISNTENFQKKLKMEPSMYQDGKNITTPSTEKTRISGRVYPVAKPHNSLCYNSSSTLGKNIISPLKTFVENNQKVQGDPDIEFLETNEEEKLQKHTGVGPYFQAQVPEWTELFIESESKWLGTRMWPPENGKKYSDFESNFTENSRNQSCKCRFRNSVACVRFHIAENRMKLRREIGSLFYKWNFHLMGEEVSLSWTIEEEKRFKLMEKLNLSSPKNCFWDNIAKFFPDKSKEKLVNYYFNVFLIGRRAYQNRVTPEDVDSDDDNESEFGCVGGRFGNEALCFERSEKQCAG